MRGSTPLQRPAPARQRRRSGGVSLARPSRSAAPAPGVSCPLPCGPLLTGVIIVYIAEVMRNADRLYAHLLRGRAQGPAKVIQSRRGQCFRRDSFRPGGGPPLPGRFAALLPSSGPLCVSPPWRLCAAFSFSGCNFTRLYFSFVLRPSCACVRRLRSLRCRVWRFPWLSVGRSRGGGACISFRQCSRLGASGAAVGRSGSRRGRRRSGRVRRGPADFFRRSALIAPPGLPGVRLPAPKSLRAKSRPRQPFSRSAGLNYSRWG